MAGTLNSDTASFTSGDVDNIHHVVRTLRVALESSGAIQLNDMDFPFNYYHKAIHENTGIPRNQIAQSFYHWGVANGAFSYAYMAVKGACKYIEGQNPRFQMPETVIKEIESGLKTTVDFEIYIRNQELGNKAVGPAAAPRETLVGGYGC